MGDSGSRGGALGLLSPSIVAAGILAGAAVVARGSASSAWWTLHGGAVVMGVALLLGAAVEMNRSAYPAGAVLASAFIVALALLVSASILGDPARGSRLVPVWGVSGGFLAILLPRRNDTARAAGWSLVGASVLLATGVVLGTLILVR